MARVLRSLLVLLSEICTTLFYQQDIPHEHKQGLAASLKMFEDAVKDFERK
jgi:hypothetical protein